MKNIRQIRILMVTLHRLLKGPIKAYLLELDDLCDKLYGWWKAGCKPATSEPATQSAASPASPAPPVASSSKTPAQSAVTQMGPLMPEADSEMTEVV